MWITCVFGIRINLWKIGSGSVGDFRDFRDFETGYSSKKNQEDRSSIGLVFSRFTLLGLSLEVPKVPEVPRWSIQIQNNGVFICF